MSASEHRVNIAATPKNFYTEALNPKNLEGTNLIEEKPEGRQLNGEKIDLVNFHEFTVVILPVYLAIAAGALFIFQLLRKREQNYVSSDFLSRLNQVPCVNCHFFTTNSYLKCAVNPSTVLTKQAIDCPDYCPCNGKSLR